jgi:hypothetical protein
MNVFRSTTAVSLEHLLCAFAGLDTTSCSVRTHTQYVSTAASAQADRLTGRLLGFFPIGWLYAARLLGANVISIRLRRLERRLSRCMVSPEGLLAWNMGL